jgi:DNA-binding NarL/FixJ family response regulator
MTERLPVAGDELDAKTIPSLSPREWLHCATEKSRWRPRVTPGGHPHAPAVRVIVMSRLSLLGQALAQALQGMEVHVLAPAADEQGALDALAHESSQVVLLDLASLGEDGIRIGTVIMKEHPRVKILALGDPGPSPGRSEASQSFHGWLTADVSFPNVVRSIRKVQAGEKVLEGIRPTRGTLSKEQGEDLPFLIKFLTRRERQVLDLLAQGIRPPQIATRLGISRHTVRAHISHILPKLNVHSQLEAVVVATGLRPSASETQRGQGDEEGHQVGA